jgi:hypothetical protein
MYVINHSEISLPQLKESMLDFSKGLYEYDLIHIPFTQEANHSTKFEDFQFAIADVLRENYYMPDNEVEPEFENSIDGELYFNIIFTNIDKCNFRCKFTISTFANEVMAEMEIGLSDDEYSMALLIIQHKFKLVTINTIRAEIVASISQGLSYDYLQQFKLVSDQIDNTRYRGAWVSANYKHCLVVELDDYTNKNDMVKAFKYDLAA